MQAYVERSRNGDEELFSEQNVQPEEHLENVAVLARGCSVVQQPGAIGAAPACGWWTEWRCMLIDEGGVAQVRGARADAPSAGRGGRRERRRRRLATARGVEEPEVERNAEVFTRRVQNVNCIETIGAQGSGSGTKWGSFHKTRRKREL